MKYFLYARKSTEDKARQIQSIPDQLRILGELAKQRGLEIVETITDIKSAKAPGRTGFSSMMQRIQSGEADGILCWKIDRLSRNSVDGGTLMWTLQNSIIREIVTPERTYYPQDNTLLLSVEFGLATQMIRDLSVNVKRGMQSKIEKGWMPSFAPIGYINEKFAMKGEKRILPDPVLFPIIKGLWLYLLQSRCSLTELYNHMQKQCPIYSKGKLIPFSSFHEIFQNKFYCGLFVWKGECQIGAHEQMITQREFDEAQSFLYERRGVRERSLEFDLKGEFRCGTCNAMITAEEHRKLVKSLGEVKAYRFYRCHRHKRGVTCKEKPLSESKIEAQIIQSIEEMNLPDDVINLGLETLDQMQATSDESVAEKQLKRQLSELTQKIEVVENNLAEESSSDARTVIMRKLNELRINRQSIEQDISKVQFERKNRHVTIRNSLELIHHAKQTFKHGSKAQRKAVLRGLGSNWILSQQKLSFEPCVVAVALKKTRELHSADIHKFELTKSQSVSTTSIDQSFASKVWSSLWELIAEYSELRIGVSKFIQS